MSLPTTHEFAALLAGQPSGSLSSASGVPSRSGWARGPRSSARTRWHGGGSSPRRRPSARAAEFERTSGGVVADALPTKPGGVQRPSDAIVINAYMSAYGQAARLGRLQR